MINDILESANIFNCENIIERSCGFQGDGYLELDRTAIAESSSQTSNGLAIWFSVSKPNGLIFWYGQDKEVEFDGEDFMALAVVDGLLEFVFRMDGEETVIRHELELDTRHVAIIKRNGNQASVELDGNTEYSETRPTARKSMFLPGNIFLGGKFFKFEITCVINLDKFKVVRKIL